MSDTDEYAAMTEQERCGLDASMAALAAAATALVVVLLAPLVPIVNRLASWMARPAANTRQGAGHPPTREGDGSPGGIEPISPRQISTWQVV